MIIRKEFENGYLIYDRPNVPNGILFIEELGLTNTENLAGKEAKIFAKFILRFAEYVKEVKFKNVNTYAEMIDDYSSIEVIRDIFKEFCESMSPSAEKKI